jgi:hypothetical protein
MGWHQAHAVPVSNHGHHIFQWREISRQIGRNLLPDVTKKAQPI